MLLVFLEFIQTNPSVHALCLSSDYVVVVIQASPIYRYGCGPKCINRYYQVVFYIDCPCM